MDSASRIALAYSLGSSRKAEVSMLQVEKIFDRMPKARTGFLSKAKTNPGVLCVLGIAMAALNAGYAPDTVVSNIEEGLQ